MSDYNKVIQMPQPANQEIRTPLVQLGRHGNQVCALIGPILEDGICGYGGTAAEALRDLAERIELEEYFVDGIDYD